MTTDEAATERAAIQAEANTIAVTMFSNLSAQTKKETWMPWAGLVKRVLEPKPYATKTAMPLIKLARFGDLRSDKDCLRNDTNVLAVYGIEGDYDAGEVTLADAATMLADAGIHAALYSSPNSTADKPRWRALCPLAHEHPPTKRREFVGRLNRMLGGILGAESFPLSQSFYIGQARLRDDGTAADYQSQEVRGYRYLDEAVDIEPLYPSNGSAGVSAAGTALDDPLLRALQERKLVKGPIKPGTWALLCPWEHEHTGPSGTSDTAYLQANFEGRVLAGFKCLHGHCHGRTLRDLRTFLGVDGKAANDSTPSASAPAEEKSTLDYSFAHELGDSGDEADELIERLLTRGAGSVLYGDTNSGKTFCAIDLGCAVARHTVWMRRNVEPGMVVYLASESPASVRLRLRAYQKHHGCKVPNFAIVRSPIDLYNGAADTVRVIDLVRKLEQRLGVKCELIIGDTLSRLSAGANENSGEDMSIVVRHVDRIRHECAAHFLLIHHTGKDAARGMRGWSGMRAATDTEIEITADIESSIHAAEITKQRDIPGKGDRIGFRLQVVEMGIGKWGKAITSCVVVNADAPPKIAANKRPSEIAGAITEVLTSRGAGMRKGDLVAHFDGRYVRSAVYRELKKMADGGKVREVVGIVALARS